MARFSDRSRSRTDIVVIPIARAFWTYRRGVHSARAVAGNGVSALRNEPEAILQNLRKNRISPGTRIATTELRPTALAAV